MTLSALRSHEVIRKAIHLLSGAIPLLYWFYFDREIMLRGILILATGFLLAEYLRLHYDWARKLFMSAFGSSIRDHERHKLTGATYVFTGAVITIFLFPKVIAVAGLLTLSISDTFAALIGIPFGKHRFLKKSVEGSLRFLVSTLIILTIFFPGRLIPNILVAVLMTIAEAYPVGLDDNFLIPLLSGGLLLLAGLL